MNIHLITNQTGFPFGTAAAQRIRMIGKSIMASGNGFYIYSNDLSFNKFNIAAEGIYENIGFRYLHGTTNLAVGKLKKLFLYIKGIQTLNSILAKMVPGRDIIYIYAHGNIFNPIVMLLCKKYKLKIIEEINEWDHDDIKGPFKKFISQGPMVKWADGAVVISKHINDTVLRINPLLKTIVVPVLESAGTYSGNGAAADNAGKYCFWMGLVNGYLEDVLLIVEACGTAYNNGTRFDLVISGPYNEASATRIAEKARAANYPESRIRLLGYIDETTLHEYCMNAFFYIVPLWNNQKSLYRFPTKMASFMFCGKPVITCKVGDVGEMLTDGENVVFFTPGSVAELSAAITSLLRDDARYERIAQNTRQFAQQYFNYAAYSQPLHDLFRSIIKAP